jgi:Mrp family chromosome partitioning ATPase
MEPIKAAVERLKANRFSDSAKRDQFNAAGRQSIPIVGRPARAEGHGEEFVLNGPHLESRRIVGHDSADPRSKAFDMLRTQVLQAMDRKAWQIIAVTSPTAGCGKTFVALNLALSVARQPERSSLLVDMDLKRPQVASCLGIGKGPGLTDVLAGQAALSDVIDQVVVGSVRCAVLRSGEGSIEDSSEWTASRAMTGVLEDLRRDYRSRIVLLDLPPILSSDDVLTILPQIDCVLLVAGAGITTPAQIEDCGKHLHSAEVVRVVLNKAPDSTTKYYSGDY